MKELVNRLNEARKAYYEGESISFRQSTTPMRCVAPMDVVLCLKLIEGIFIIPKFR